ncbi:MAG: rod-binding protein [Desulfobacterota bacterium]|nr:rod-binding protein [Thermodesulfobacteriota bacterium]
MDTTSVGIGMYYPAVGAIERTQPAPSAGDTNDKRLREQCREFESLLYGVLLETMRKTVDKSGLIDGGRAEDIYTSLLDTEYAKIMAGNVRHGIADALYHQLKKQNNRQVDTLDGATTKKYHTDRAALLRKGG